MPSKKQIELLDAFLAQVSKDNVDLYRDIIDYLISCKFTPKKCKAADFGLDFYNSKLKQTIAKIYDNDFRLKFYASKDYSKKFKDGIKTVIEEFDGKYTGCYGCGRCTDELQGYTYYYEGGKKVFRCGRELITIPGVAKQDFEEIKKLIDAQYKYWMDRNS